MVVIQQSTVVDSTADKVRQCLIAITIILIIAAAVTGIYNIVNKIKNYTPLGLGIGAMVALASYALVPLFVVVKQKNDAARRELDKSTNSDFLTKQ